jgi:F0F1-type ATP synthase epsilon subunit
MNALAKKQVPEQAWGEVGTVTAIAGAVITVRSGSCLRIARRAASCLLQPAEGDRVLLALTDQDETFVVAVLESAGSDATLSFDGDVRLQTKSGRLTMVARDGIDLVSGRTVRVAAEAVSVTSKRASMVTDALSVVGGVLDANLEKIKVVAKTTETVVDACIQRAKRAYRFVEELDRLRSAQVDYVAKGRMNLRGETTLVTAEALVKVDGSQIHVG